MRYYYLEVATEHKAGKPLHPSIGSMLRGAFGYALKHTVCVHPRRECEGCVSAPHCLYHEYFEVENSTPDYRFDYTLYPGKLDFGLYLYGESAMQKLPYILHAIHRMLEKTGVGADRERYTIESIYCNGVRIYDGGCFSSLALEPRIWQPKAPDAPTHATLHLLTPLRIKQDNRFVREALPSLEMLLQSIANRYAEIMNTPKSKVRDIAGEIVSQEVLFAQFARYSAKQQRKMFMGGLLGRVVLQGLNGRAIELLKLGELIGAGKSTVFGMGKIKLEEVV